MISKLFLPFAAQGRQIEEQAIKIKDEHGFGPYDPVDPLVLAQRMGVCVVPESWFGTLPAEIADPAIVTFGRAWSAGSISCAGHLWVLVNPSHLPTRKAISLAEELVHENLGHPKSQLLEVDGIAIRTCDQSIEDEAYSVAAALLVPYKPLFNLVNSGRPLEEFEAAVPVSREALEFRIKRAGLWRTYQARRRSGGPTA